MQLSLEMNTYCYFDHDFVSEVYGCNYEEAMM